MHHIYYSKIKFIEMGGKAVFIIYHLPKMEGAKRMSEQTYMYEQETAAADVTVLHTPLKISRSRKMLLNCWSRHYVQNGTNA